MQSHPIDNGNKEDAPRRLGPLLLERITDEKDNNKRNNAILALTHFVQQLGYREQIEYIKTCITQLSLDVDDQLVHENKQSVAELYEAFETAYQAYQKEEQEIRAIWDNNNGKSQKDLLKAIDKVRKKYKDPHKEPGKSYHAAKKQIKAILRTLHDAIIETTSQLSFDNTHAPAWKQIIRQALTVPHTIEEGLADIPPIQKGKYIWDARVPKAAQPIHSHDKQSLLLYLSRDMADYRCISPKRGGANNPGDFGGNYLGFYEDHEGQLQTQMVFFKQATDQPEINHRENIAEVMSGNIMRTMVGNHTASTFFVDSPQKTDDKDSRVYVGSIFYDGFQDLTSLKGSLNYTYRGLHKDHAFKPIEGFKRKAGTDDDLRMHSTVRLLVYGGYPIKPNPEQDADFLNENKPIRGLGQVLGSSLLVGNTQFHTDNTAIAKLNDQYEFVGVFVFFSYFSNKDKPIRQLNALTTSVECSLSLTR